MNSDQMDIIKMEEEFDNFYAPGFSITVDGVDLLRNGAEISSVNVDNDLAGADQFSFTINNPFNPHNGRFEWLDNGLIQNEKLVEIKIGYTDKLKFMILGMVGSIKASFKAEGASQLQIEGYDLSYRMMKGKVKESWNRKTDSAVVSEIADKYGLSKNIDDTRIEFPQIKQDGETDFDFVGKLAERNGFEFSVFERELNFISPPADPEVIAVLNYGKTLTDFSPEVTSTDQVNEVKVTGWDIAKKLEIVGNARAPGITEGNENVEEIRKPVYSIEEASRFAESILKKIMRGRVKGNGECIGLPHLKPGKGIRIEGLGSFFSKIYYIEKTTHTISSTSGYKTTFSVREAGI